MQRALYDPAHGYYASGRAAVGREGDFFTSVSVGPLFGALLARQFEEVWKRLGSPALFSIIEQGAHHGDLARDILSALENIAPDCFAAAQLHIIDPFPAQRDAQQRTLGPLCSKTRWLEHLDQLQPFTGVFYANELLDAFPVERVRWSGSHWEQLHVDLKDDTFVWTGARSQDPVLLASIEHLPRNLPSGFTTELHLEACTWMRQAAARLANGILLLIDYGYTRSEYYRPERHEGTLTGYRAHQQTRDILANPGTMDLTAHVEFTTLAETAEQAGLRVHGFCPQHQFLVGVSPLHFPPQLEPGPETDRDLRAFKTLMHPSMLGASFKVLCLEKNPLTPLSGFRFGGNPRANLELRVSE